MTSETDLGEQFQSNLNERIIADALTNVGLNNENSHCMK